MKQNTHTDAVLVSAYINGDESALSHLITRHKQRIYS
ncbi:MAG TPA: RNA polymerase subunit sigma-24, partial [Flavobacteriaceae bacterium]|nr:RNA polymerase subunit sigma-24 [Flavobacteriaceae bacterium]